MSRCADVIASDAQFGRLRRLARRLIADHSKSLSDAKQAASTLGVQLELQPTQTQQWQLQLVRQMSTRSFNHWYSSLEVKDHQQDIRETSFETSKGTSPDVMKLASDDLPVLRLHLSLAHRALNASPRA